jgi:nitrate/TMAO reductase-like tetraheme cytochrome c subunit
MSRRFKSFLLIFLGIILAFPLFSITYYTMVRTSTPSFCASCHEIQFAYNTWKTSSHVNNSSGFIADCMDCHLPAPQDTVNFFYSKTLHGVKDIFVHVVQGSERYSHKEARKKAYESMKNEQCLKCHRNILYLPDKRGAMLAHRTVMFPREGYSKRCTDCHYNLVHNERSAYSYRR